MHAAADVATPAWEERLRKITIVIACLGLAYLFLTQLFWKLPPTFGCTNDFAFPVAAQMTLPFLWLRKGPTIGTATAAAVSATGWVWNPFTRPATAKCW